MTLKQGDPHCDPIGTRGARRLHVSLRDAPLRFLGQLAPSAAAGWKTLGERAYRGDLDLATDNSTYRFHDGVFVSRAKQPQTFFDAPRSMHGLLLVGFLTEDDARDRWIHATAWRAGAHAVFWRAGGLDTAAFMLTSPTKSISHDPEPSPWVGERRMRPGTTRKVQRRIARPPSLHLPTAPSMTRLHSAATRADQR